MQCQQLYKHLSEVSAKILEINPNHSIIKSLNKIDTEDKKNIDELKNISNLLLDQAKYLLSNLHQLITALIVFLQIFKMLIMLCYNNINLISD